MKTSSLLQKIIVCAAIGLLASCVSQSPNSTATSPPIEITSFPSALKMDNTNIEFSGYEFDNNDLWITICFEPQREGDWVFGKITLKIDDQELPTYGVSRDPEPGRADGFECETIIYYSVMHSGKAELTIGRLGLSVDFEEQDCKTAQKNLDEAKTGIVVTCDPTTTGAFTITKKPTFMSIDDAFLIAMDAFSYSEAISLNWRFSFLIEKP